MLVRASSCGLLTPGAQLSIRLALDFGSQTKGLRRNSATSIFSSVSFVQPGVVYSQEPQSVGPESAFRFSFTLLGPSAAGAAHLHDFVVPGFIIAALYRLDVVRWIAAVLAGSHDRLGIAGEFPEGGRFGGESGVQFFRCWMLRCERLDVGYWHVSNGLRRYCYSASSFVCTRWLLNR